ncbi:MAG: hypothetical protein J6C11_06115 [Spirochaetaceae bacterium]|nr:hypothetical protein [Spirochaetaceae bacterium]
MTKWYEMQVVDTLFFRGTTPMEAGLANAVSLFPPPVSVLQGAFWTAYCRNKNQAFTVGLKEGKIPLEIKGILVKKKIKKVDKGPHEERLYVPAPATWYYDSEKKVKSSKDFEGKCLCIAETKKESFDTFGIQSSAGELVFVAPQHEAQSLSNAWIAVDFIKSPQEQFGAYDVLLEKDVLSRESRTGVGLTDGRLAKDGQLYSSTHIRLLDDVTLVVALDSEHDVGSGKLQLGGEQRIVSYKELEDMSTFTEQGAEQFLSLVPVEATEENLKRLVASQKLVVTAGWDLAKGFHKPTTSWIPAGAVFNENIDDNCMPMGMQEKNKR